MAIELQVLLGVCVGGTVQALLLGRVEALRQIHRNFSETFYFFGTSILLLSMLDGFGAWSFKGAIAYAAGRLSYLALSVKPTRPLRKWAWAISIAGIVGCLGELLRAASTI